jgi:hypothetical protein
MTRKHRWLWLVLTLLLIAGCGSGKGGQGLILYSTFDEDGPQPELVVIDADGKEQGRISLSDTVQWDYVARGGQRALVGTFDGAVYLVDAVAGSAQELELPEEAQGQLVPNTSQFRLSGGGERWTLLGDPRGGLAFLVNLKTGQVHDLTAIDEGLKLIFYGRFAPNEEYVIVGDHWLLPTANPSAARRLGSGKSAFGGNFSSDGKQIVYLQKAETEGLEVVVEQVDGSKSEVVTSGDWVSEARFVPGKNQLVYQKSDKLFLFSLNNGKERELLTCGEHPLLWLAPSGQKLLASCLEDDTQVWYLVDLKGGAAKSLHDLREYTPYFMDRAHRWLIFVDDTSLGSGGRRLVGLDLESDETRQALVLDEETTYMGLRSSSSDGKFGLVYAQTENKKAQLWLLRADGGEPRLLAEKESFPYGVFSPDDRWVAVSTMEKVNDHVETQLTLMETEGEGTRSVGEGFRPIWVRP